MFPLNKRDTTGLYKFGQYTFYGRKHAGQDYRTTKDTYYLPFSGQVKVGYGFEGGYFVEVKRDNGDVVTGRHFSKLLITNGYHKEGTPAAITGNSGAFTTGEHLHLETLVQGKLTDPEQYSWTTFPITIRVCLLMNFKEQWKGAALAELQTWFEQNSKGRVKLELYPLYTRFLGFEYSFEGVSGDPRPVIDRMYFNEYVLPLSFGNPHITALVVHPDDWKGPQFGHDPEKGWYYLPTTVPGDTSHLPSKCFVVCKDGEMSQYSFGITAFTEYLRHELFHFLFDKGQPSKFDFTHINQSNNEMAKGFDQLDYELLSRTINS